MLDKQNSKNRNWAHIGCTQQATFLTHYTVKDTVGEDGIFSGSGGTFRMHHSAIRAQESLKLYQG